MRLFFLISIPLIFLLPLAALGDPPTDTDMPRGFLRLNDPRLPDALRLQLEELARFIGKLEGVQMGGLGTEALSPVSGTGFSINYGTQPMVLSAYHVIEPLFGAGTLTTSQGRYELDPTPRPGSWPTGDIGVLWPTRRRELPLPDAFGPLGYLGQSDSLMGQPVAVIGHPSGIPYPVVSFGKVITQSPGFFRTTALVTGGSSGSPVFSVEGGQISRLLGLVSAGVGPFSKHTNALNGALFSEEERNVNWHAREGRDSIEFGLMSAKFKGSIEDLGELRDTLHHLETEMDDARLRSQIYRANRRLLSNLNDLVETLPIDVSLPTLDREMIDEYQAEELRMYASQLKDKLGGFLEHVHSRPSEIYERIEAIHSGASRGERLCVENLNRLALPTNSEVAPFSNQMARELLR